MLQIKAIAKISTPFKTKFGVPRQSGIVPELEAEIVFEPEYRSEAALRGIEEFSHLWLLWEFSENKRETWSPTVRPPRLGGNVHMGVFATRSPFRPNPIGLSCVKLLDVVNTGDRGVVLRVSGADLMNGTPIYDIKPYVPYADCHPEAKGGFTDKTDFKTLSVNIPESLSGKLSAQNLEALKGVLANDPRPQYHDDPEREYGFAFGEREVKFKVKDEVLTVTDIF